MPYITGYVYSVPDALKDGYRTYAEKSWEVFRDFGCLAAWNCWGDDVPEGELTSFPMAVQCRKGETVVLSWHEWPDKATAERCMEAMPTDPRLAALGDLPFDGKRMIYGGFTPILSVRA